MVDGITGRGLFRYVTGATFIFLMLLVAFSDVDLVRIVNGLYLGVAAMAYIVFSPLAWRAINSRKFDRISQLSMGIVFVLTSCTISRFANALPRMDHTISMTWVASSWIVALSGWFGVVGGVLFVTAPGTVEDQWVYNRNILRAGVVIGIVTAMTMTFLQWP